jgi:hypothetical protein
LHIEDILPQVGADVTIIHTEYDPLTTHAYASRLAETPRAKLVLMPGVSHSWPKADSARFSDSLTSCCAEDDVDIAAAGHLRG